MKLKALCALGLLVASNSQAQMNNNQYHQNQQRIQNQNHVAEQNRQGYMNSQQQMQQPQQPPQPTGYWEKTWGALATSETGGALGVAVGASNEAQARQTAMADCTSQGGGGCRVDLTYRNQCGVMTLGSDGVFTASAGTLEEAEAYGLELCEERDTSCRVYHSACTKPVFRRY